MPDPDLLPPEPNLVACNAVIPAHIVGGRCLGYP